MSASPGAGGGPDPRHPRSLRLGCRSLAPRGLQLRLGGLLLLAPDRGQLGVEVGSHRGGGLLDGELLPRHGPQLGRVEAAAGVPQLGRLLRHLLGLLLLAEQLDPVRDGRGDEAREARHGETQRPVTAPFTLLLLLHTADPKIRDSRDSQDS